MKGKYLDPKADLTFKQIIGDLPAEKLRERLKVINSRTEKETYLPFLCEFS